MPLKACGLNWRRHSTISSFRKGNSHLFQDHPAQRDSSVPPVDIPIEEIQRDEAIDCQVGEDFSRSSLIILRI